MPVQAFRSLPQHLTKLQQEVVSFPREGGGSLAVRGLPGTGKSTALMARLAALLREGRRPHEVLVLVPQRAQIERYERVLGGLAAPTRGGVDVVTFYALSKRAVALFWPLVADAAEFARPAREPTVLTVETAQDLRWRVVEPLITEKGYFSDLAIRRGRLLSQLIDNLNKSALVGFDYTDIYERLRQAWTGTPDRINSYWQAQDCAIRFRHYCLEHNLLDFSLTTEVYCRHLLTNEVYQRYLGARYRHLLVDNLEENVPVAHDFIDWAREEFQSTLLVYDGGGGYRIFLGADAVRGLEVVNGCSHQLTFGELLEPTAHCLAFSDALRRALKLQGGQASPTGEFRRAVANPGSEKYWIGMIRWVARQVAALVSDGIPAGEIAIVAPYVSEVMRFAIEEHLGQQGIRLYLLRPATSLRDDPVVRALLILTMLGHPDWQVIIQGRPYQMSVDDVALVLHVALAGLDPIRAHRLAKGALSDGRLADLSGGGAGGKPTQRLGQLWEYVGYQLRQRYETLRVWLETYHQGQAEPVDIFLSRFFGDLLSRPGYGFHEDPHRARAYGRLVESAYKFRSAAGLDQELDQEVVARGYVELILGGIASAEYLLDWPRPTPDAVVLAPAYAYLTRDLRSRHQFWIDLGSDGWWNRPNQPLTHPYVLSRHWESGRLWRDVEEEQTRREALGRVIQGLAARCTGTIYLASSELGIGGEEQGGQLQRAVMIAFTRRMDSG
ncbi:MAG: hypothetical protein E3J25_08560 [Anaerolineales bacterium]|nr:MAG: hypothetical protein E3J25_08560 [Anaerolineales bacterium]